MKSMSKLFVLVALFLVAVLVVGGLSYSPDAYATKEIYKAARDKFGKEVKGCKHCHVKALPKEGSSELNEVGTFLMKQKEEKGADEVDVAWLADYKPSN